jgi:DNA-3-methyladenine glycosylase II
MTIRTGMSNLGRSSLLLPALVGLFLASGCKKPPQKKAEPPPAVAPAPVEAPATTAVTAPATTAIELVGPCTLKRGRGSPYEALLSAIAHQQIHGNAAAAILGRFRALYGGRGYPTPAQLVATPDAQLRACGLSRAKLAAMKDVAAKTIDGTVPDRRTIARLGDEVIIERLTEVRGVGRWTAEMLLMFTLNRPDILPVDDFGIREGFRLLYGKRQQPRPRQLAAYGVRWAPYRTTASWYLWRYVEHVRAALRAG